MPPPKDTAVVGVTFEPKDHLTCLPSELLHEVISYLFPTHVEASKPTPKDDEPHPILLLAATNRYLKASTNQWANSWLQQHAHRTKYKDIKDTKRLATRNFLTGRFGLLTWLHKHCAFCGKNSVRRAVLMNGLRCCTQCDKFEWPDKITKTEAKKLFSFGDAHLYEGVLGCKIRWGSYNGYMGWTTMMLRDDARRLGEAVQRDLVERKKRRAEDGERRRAAKKMAAKLAREAARACGKRTNE